MQIYKRRRILFCSIPRKSATIRRAERKAVSPEVIGAAITPKMASTPPTAPSHSFRYRIYNNGSIAFFHSVFMEKVSSGSSPNQCHDPFGHHRSIKNRTAILLILHTTCHQRALRSMKTRNGTTCNTHKHNRKNRKLTCFGICILQTIPKFRQSRMVNVEHHQNAYCHKQQGNRKYRINFTYYFINRK